MLKAIVIPLQRAHIRWKSSESYDQWDAIAQTLWEQVVVDAISYGISKHEIALSVPKYGLTYTDYSAFSFVEVRQDRNKISNLAVVALSNRDAAFAVVHCDKIDNTGRRIDSASIPIGDRAFVFRHRKAGGALEDVTEFEFEN